MVRFILLMVHLTFLINGFVQGSREARMRRLRQPKPIQPVLFAQRAHVSAPIWLLPRQAEYTFQGTTPALG